MKLKALKLENFRSFQEETIISFDDLTTLVGRNDVGKSSILDALGLFFDYPLCKFEPAERKLNDSNRANIIYAIEEPETSQHPNYQKLVISTLKDLSTQEGCQIILTTHVPALAGMVPVNSVRRIIQNADKQRRIEFGTDEILQSIADDLGVFPNQQVQEFVRLEGPKVFVCVEGPTDVSFFHHVSQLFQKEVDQTLPCTKTDPRIIVLALGGSTLQDWVDNHYLKSFKLPEFHLYDRDEDFKYQSACDAVNARNEGSQAYLTNKREIENYLHPAAIWE